MDTKKCNKCHRLLFVSDFHKRTASSDGLDNACKECRKGTNYGRNTNLQEAPERDREPAEQILTALGYELYNDDNPIHEQFNRRLATKYNYK